MPIEEKMIDPAQDDADAFEPYWQSRRDIEEERYNPRERTRCETLRPLVTDETIEEPDDEE